MFGELRQPLRMSARCRHYKCLDDMESWCDRGRRLVGDAALAEFTPVTSLSGHRHKPDSASDHHQCIWTRRHMYGICKMCFAENKMTTAKLHSLYLSYIYIRGIIYRTERICWCSEAGSVILGETDVYLSAAGVACFRMVHQDILRCWDTLRLSRRYLYI